MATPAGIAPTRRSNRLAGKDPAAVPPIAAAPAAPSGSHTTKKHAAPKAPGAARSAKKARTNTWNVEEDPNHPRALNFKGKNFALVPAPQYGSRRRFAAGNDAAHPQFLNREADTSVTESKGRTWRFAKHLGAGSNGAVTLWLLINDKDQIIVDRICVKHAAFDNKVYHNQTMWEEGWKGSRDRPSEAILHQKLAEAGPAGETNILPLYAWHYDTERRALKMYMEFAEHGDLTGILPNGDDVLRNGTFGEGKKEKTVETEDGVLADWELPEPYVWWILLGLVRASMTMDRGDPSKEGKQAEDEDVGDDASDKKKSKGKVKPKPKPKTKVKSKVKGKGKATAPIWLPLVHRDLKPMNIMMGPFDEHDDLKKWKLKWPTLWLADFGTSMELDHEYWENPVDYRGTMFGTEGFVAPEQFEYDKGHDDEEGPPFGSWTNVWSIGMIGYWLTRGINVADDIETEWGDGAGGGMYATRDGDELTYPQGCGYSEDLQNFCKECVRLDPTTRPVLDDGLVTRLRDAFNQAMTNATMQARAVKYKVFDETGDHQKKMIAAKKKVSVGTKAKDALEGAKKALDKLDKEEAKKKGL